ncbi:TPA: hypothetical protein RGJ51_000351 [Cronobacter sakazakii]|nr:hypothetical protein [Cronobacter sakazakii]
MFIRVLQSRCVKISYCLFLFIFLSYKLLRVILLKVTDFHLVHYALRALGGAALIFPETCAVQENGQIGLGDLGIWKDSHIEGLSHLTDIIHKMGVKAGVQIGHEGRQVGYEHHRAVAPSTIPFTNESRVPEALRVGEIREIVKAFSAAAVRAKGTGFDVIEVQTVHRYLLNGFLLSLANQRTDEYGGSHENRYRIVREVIDAVRAEWKGLMFVCISSTDYKERGRVMSAPGTMRAL